LQDITNCSWKKAWKTHILRIIRKTKKKCWNLWYSCNTL